MTDYTEQARQALACYATPVDCVAALLDLVDRQTETLKIAQSALHAMEALLISKQGK